MPYSSLTPDTEKECLFCKIRDGEIPSEKLHSDDDCFVIRDINPAAPTHLLIIPTRHFATLSELADEHARIYASMIVVGRNLAAQLGFEESGYRLVVNQGRDGNQSVAHLHMHLLGGRQLGIMG